MSKHKNIYQSAQFTTMDSKKRITLPEKVCEVLNIKEGARFLVVADKSKSKIMLYPIIIGEDKFAELYMKLRDIPGVLGKVATELGKMNINIESSIITPSVEKISDFNAIINCKNCKLSLVEVEEKLKKLENTIEVEITPVE
ncbi:MAG: ACT domain-containing protein [Candidatus Freyarchaeota archaeon]|nr:ACT domain-containing protein [Candidatus Jordarchaeia archaeon]MBS7269070.1 ACT domain-containing protein [Candidatus Jordarchaeia archaeon]MBS7279898.1 ACT domain-containing protein [Candidatus Jordarchaeia archaeon]